MVDNFDSNIARRKPNVSSRRPMHPWDVPIAPSVEQHPDPGVPEIPPDSAPASFVAIPEPSPAPAPAPALSPIPAPEQPVAPVRAEISRSVSYATDSGSISATKTEIARTRKSDLSDSINIHSNFCKLDNDISDYLLQKLSASAQAVYLRLYRQSFGWNRNWAAESLPKLVEFCNLSLQTVRKAIKELEVLGCIKKEFSDYHKATVYRIYLPSEIGIGKNTASNTALANMRGLNTNSQNMRDSRRNAPNSPRVLSPGQISDGDDSHTGEYQILEESPSFAGPQNSYIQSVFFSGINIYNILETGAPLPKNILTYMTDIHLASAVDTIDEFYDSIGFSVVSRSLYRKSLLDYIDLIKSGFSGDDIRYAVRWTFKNSRSRPDSFSLIKHTMHLAMNDLIQELKQVSGEKDVIREKQDAIQKTREWNARESSRPVSAGEMGLWLQVVEDLRNVLNEHSFSAFIEPLRLDAVEEDRILLAAPPDSVSWVNDHYVERIRECYRERTGRSLDVEVR